ncbi:ribosome maturation factor RimM [Buchnera aphidicola (Chaitoregma tattakana)]|uniref:ribosome maturation factor RimM n=1 Tax=Buchnera aphidicola TaxID=9 RepID=UPI0031B7FB52
MLVVGIIKKSFGIFGWLKLVSFTEKQKNMFNYLPLYICIKKEYKKIEIKKWKIYKKNILVKIKNVENRTESEKFVKKKIFANKSSIPILTQNEYYYKDIIKCKVYDNKNNFLGIVLKIIDAKTSSILLIKLNDTLKNLNKEILIPFIINEYIKEINIKKKQIIVKNYIYFI